MRQTTRRASALVAALTLADGSTRFLRGARPHTNVPIAQTFGRAAAARAELPIAAYCVPGVTAVRCRGVFWETGKLYRKSDTETLTDADEDALRTKLTELRRSLRLAEPRDVDELGAIASEARATLRATGSRLCRGREGENRRGCESRLNACLAALDDADAAAEREARSERVLAVALGFRRSGLFLEVARSRLDDFMSGLDGIDE